MKTATISQKSQIIMYNDCLMAGRPPTTPATESGERLAALRKAAGLSQAQLAEALDIPKRTITFYERKAYNLPSGLLPKLAEVLGTSIEEILGLESKIPNKRGPKSKLEARLEQAKLLPKKDQDYIVETIDRVLGQHQQKAS